MARLERSEFRLPKMDCPTEERAVRLALEGRPAVRQLAFDLPARQLTVWHAEGAVAQVEAALVPLGFGSQLVGTTAAEAPAAPAAAEAQGATLKIVLGINAVMFVVELVTGWLAQSTGLLADSLDMFADAAVYGLALYAVGRARSLELRAARLSGYLQLLLGLGALAEVLRRAVWGSDPEPTWMIGIAALALVANATCLWLIARHREGGAHMKASYIFSTNDVLANAGVIAAALLVLWTGTRWPDLVIGLGIAALVLTGAVRILRVAR